jgi:SAM-dependent methyltransferase
MFRNESLNNLLVRLVGWIATVLHGDSAVLDRWLWLRRRLLEGDLRTLDAGCGSGAFSLYAAKLGNDVTGVSFNERDNAIAEERARILGISKARFVTGDLREIDSFADRLGTFDQILCLETIEHISDDQKLVTDLAQLLRPGGRLLLTTPSDRHRPFRGEVVSTYEDGGHVRFGYSHDELRRLFDRAGLHTVSLGYVSGPLSQMIVRIERAIGSVSALLAWVVTLPLRPLQLLDPVATRISGSPHYSVTGVAVRREAAGPKGR